MRKPLLLVCLTLGLGQGPARGDEPFRDRFVWVFGWSLETNNDVEAISRVLATAGAHGLNGAVVAFGLDTACKKSQGFFDRLERVKQDCERNGLDLIPAIFSVGYGGGILDHDQNLAEGLPVTDAPFLVTAGSARLVSDQSSLLANGDFEDFNGNHFARFDLHDQPGEISFPDTQVHHGGKASIRLENFKANPHGHGRVMQQIRVQRERCYRVTLWVRTEGLQSPRSFQVMVRGKDRELAPRTFHIPPTSDWRQLVFLFNSMKEDHVSLHAGVWGAKSGRFWIDDWRVEEVGPLNVLHRPGTPVTVRDSRGTTTHVEGVDYAPRGRKPHKARARPCRQFAVIRESASGDTSSPEADHLP